MKETLIVFNIQRYSLHDGDGIRTVFFLKGCPLRCSWCCNPESQNPRPELMFRKGKCIGKEECGQCGQLCPEKAILFKQHEAQVDFHLCRQCFACAKHCPSRALKVVGESREIEDLLDIAEQDASFYSSGGGGITLSGGEPLSQPGAVLFLKKARERYLNTAMETCGYVPKERLLEAAGYLNQIFFDIKSLDDDRHKAFTGVSGQKIRENLEALCQVWPDLPKTVRTPVIPGFNDRPEELEAIGQYLHGLAGVTWQKLPYHTYGAGKYEMLGRKYEMPV
ncbi:MAG: glycyl-radical enzyme activating protein [Eubacterium sp.]|nr:glycyl-radical enzyme activating protein [Eubacterium sp.]